MLIKVMPPLRGSNPTWSPYLPTCRPAGAYSYENPEISWRLFFDIPYGGKSFRRGGEDLGGGRKSSASGCPA